MNAGLLFYFARKTSLCQKQLGRHVGYYEISVADVKVCAKKEGLRPAMGQLISSLPVVFLVGDTPDIRPSCAPPIFETLHIPTDSKGEPKGVLRLNGAEKTGYLIESLNQAIVILPDIPGELMQMLPQACERLKQKFDLDGEPPVPPDIDYEALIENSMIHDQTEE